MKAVIRVYDDSGAVVGTRSVSVKYSSPLAQGDLAKICGDRGNRFVVSD